MHAFSFSELRSRDVTKVRMTFTRAGTRRELTVTSTYLPNYLDELLLSKGIKKSLTTTVRIKCNSMLEVILAHTTMYGGARTLIYEENA
jgi:hypothetical protein